MAIVRIILGVVVGVVAAFVTVAAIEFVGGLIFPVRDPADLAEAATAAGWVTRMPLAAQLIVVGGWLTGALVGAVAAGRVARRALVGWLPAALVTVAGIANVAMIAHPLWMIIAAVVAPLAGGWVGVRLSRTRI